MTGGLISTAFLVLLLAAVVVSAAIDLVLDIRAARERKADVGVRLPEPVQQPSTGQPPTPPQAADPRPTGGGPAVPFVCPKCGLGYLIPFGFTLVRCSRRKSMLNIANRPRMA